MPWPPDLATALLGFYLSGFFFFTTALNLTCGIFYECILPAGGLLLGDAVLIAAILLVSKAAGSADCSLNVPLPG